MGVVVADKSFLVWGDGRELVHTTPMISLSCFTFGGSWAILTKDHLQALAATLCSPPSPASQPFLTLTLLYLELGSNTCCGLLGTAEVETPPSRWSPSLLRSTWPVQCRAFSGPFLWHSPLGPFLASVQATLVLSAWLFFALLLES